MIIHEFLIRYKSDFEIFFTLNLEIIVIHDILIDIMQKLIGLHKNCKL